MGVTLRVCPPHLILLELHLQAKVANNLNKNRHMFMSGIKLKKRKNSMACAESTYITVCSP